MKTRFLTASILAVVTAGPAMAQGLEEIVVTAQRREQNIQEIPISVSAFTGAAIEQGNIRAATDYLSQTPNVSFTEDGQAGARGLGIAVRGVNNLVSGENAFAPSVGIYLDEFSVASVPNGVANPFLPDMERLEVLRGPQGTYFGRNSVGGALNLTTADPTDELGYKLTVGGESYEEGDEMFNVTGVATGALTDTFKLRGVVFYENSGGLVENICAEGASAAECPVAAANGYTPTGEEDSGHEYIMARIKGIWDVTPDTTVKATVIYSDEDQGHDENVPSGFLDIDTAATFGVTSAIDPGTGFWRDGNTDKISHDGNESNKLETIVAVLNIQHQLSDQMVVKWITGIIDAEQTRLFDNDLLGGYELVERNNTYEGQSWSTELRLESTYNSLDWTVGMLYAEDEQKQQNKVGVGASGPLLHDANPPNGVILLPPFFPEGLGLALNRKKYEVESFAVFGDMTFHMTENWDLIAGGRFSHEIVTNTLTDSTFFPGPATTPGCPITPGFCFVNADLPTVKNDEEFWDFAPRFGVRFKIDEDMSIYGMVSKGYKAGGTSLGNDPLNGEAPLISPFDKERLFNYELGLRSEWLDNRVRVNVTAFHLEWEDLQMEAFRFLQPGNLGTNFEQTINIESAEASGIEMEFLAQATDRLTFSGAFGYLDSEITSDTVATLTGDYIVSLKGLELPKAPEITASLSAEYRWPMMDNEAWVRMEYIHRDGQYSDIEGLTNRQTRGVSPVGVFRVTDPGEFPYRSPDYDVVNLRAGFDMENWNFNVYVQNLFDEKYYTGTQENFGLSGIRLKPHPRFFGGSVSYRFGGI